MLNVVDAASTLGSMAGALMYMFGATSSGYALFLPVLLPVVSLFAALQRDHLTSKVAINFAIHRCVCQYAACTSTHPIWMTMQHPQATRS